MQFPCRMHMFDTSSNDTSWNCESHNCCGYVDYNVMERSFHLNVRCAITSVQMIKCRIVRIAESIRILISNFICFMPLSGVDANYRANELLDKRQYAIEVSVIGDGCRRPRTVDFWLKAVTRFNAASQLTPKQRIRPYELSGQLAC